MAAAGMMLASAFIKEATTRLGAAIGGNIRLRWNFNEDLQEMKDTLESIEAVLQDAEKRCFNGEKTARLWLKRLRDAAEDITDMLDAYEAKTASNPRTPKLLSKIFRLRKFTKFSMAKKMKKMRRKLKNIADQHRDYGFKQESSPNYSPLPDKPEELVAVKPYIVGRTGDKEKLLSRILHANQKDVALTILPIYGNGGIGKTTLAKLLFDDAKFNNFSKEWIYVPRMSDLKEIGDFLISELSESKSDIHHSVVMTKDRLGEVLANKKVLIVLDDMWENNPSKLSSLKTMLGVGCKVIVIVTTREKYIADKICTVEPYKLPLLTSDMCWTIIKQKVDFEVRPDKDQLETVGRKIASKCGGFALAAQALGYIMLESVTFDAWEKVSDSNIWHESSSDLTVSLMFSYNRMSPYLKLCFAYCATFPKGYKIVKDDLIYQWISLGYVEPPTKLFSTWQHGENYVRHLTGMSFLQHYTTSHSAIGVHHDDVTMFTMHDVVHYLARSVMVDEILDSTQDNNTGGSRSRFALLNDCTKSFESFTQYPTKIRALRFLKSEKTVLQGASSSFHKCLVVVSGKIGLHKDVFTSAKCLRVLDLSECCIQKLPNSIGDLKQLRYLNAPRVQHKAIPKCITKLSKLIYLSLCGSSEILTMPESIGEMECLTYLDLSGCFKLENLPVSFRKLTKLVHLDLSNCHHVKDVSESLKSLTNLEYLSLSGYLKANVLVNLRNLRYLKLSACCFQRITSGPIPLGNLKHLVYLDLSFSCGGGEVLKDLGGLTKLNYLNLSQCFSFDLEWMTRNMGNLTELRYLNFSRRLFWSTHEASGFLQCISNLTNLEHLDLSHNSSIMHLPHSFSNLRRLHTLDLSGCSNLLSLPATLREMDSLKFLHLNGCHGIRMWNQSRLSKNLVTLPHFVVQAEHHDSSSNIVLLQDVNRTDLVISSLENVMSVEEVRTINLTEKEAMKELELNWTKEERFVEDKELLGELVPTSNLEKLDIVGYNSVRFPKWFDIIADHLPNLVQISMSNLSMCNSLPPLGQLPNLSKLILKQMNSISKIDWAICGTTRPWFPCLQHFSLSGMESLEVWYTTYSCDVDGMSQFMFPKLRVLEIDDCPNFRLEPCPPTTEEGWEVRGRSDGVISSSREGASQASVSSPSSAPPVTTLQISRSEVPMHQWRLLHHLTTLTELEIYKCNDLSSSPEIMEVLSSYQSLTLSGSVNQPEPEPELPNWLGELASLKKLTIQGYDVKSLQGSMGHLTRLQSLSLESIQSMTALPQWVGDLISLNQLEIIDCRNLNDLTESIRGLTSLIRLTIMGCHGFTSLTESIGGITSLNILIICDCNGITSLPDSIGGLTSLKELSIKYCNGMTSLSESIGGLTSLNKLSIRHCDDITSLPESIKQLTNLKRLKIFSCRELVEEWCQVEENNMKIAHIKQQEIC